MNRTLTLLASVFTVALSTTAAETPVDFSREILPILSNKCFVCHGPDSRKEDLLRLDSFEGATSDLGGYRAVDPGDLAKSEIIARIHDEDDPMPPEDAEKQLTAAERALLKRWVLQGGGYTEHWAFVPPTRPTPPSQDYPIDAFIENQFTGDTDFAAEADKPTLARRLALVLTGLPPSPELLQSFLDDGSSNAYDQLVERLLADPRYGEHQARYWLDAVRYGDTHGLHLDNKRGIYPYRDWVVRALNRNQPLDEFIEWQLAGDLLPEPTMEQRIATGYVRMNPTTAEGGAIPAEFQAKNNFDRTETLGTVFLGMTMLCSRCHTHKYDPIEQTEYYRLLAFFNNTAEGPLDGNKYEYGTHAEGARKPSQRGMTGHSSSRRATGCWLRPGPSQVSRSPTWPSRKAAWPSLVCRPRPGNSSSNAPTPRPDSPPRSSPGTWPSRAKPGYSIAASTTCPPVSRCSRTCSR